MYTFIRPLKVSYFKFPNRALNKPVDVGDFLLIEKKYSLNIRPDYVPKEKEGLGLKNVYRGSLTASEAPTVNLVQILEANNLAIIPHFTGSMRVLLNAKKKNRNDSSFCVQDMHESKA